MKEKLKNAIGWIYIIISILFWIVFITGIESIVENNMFALFIAIGIVDIILGKILDI